jgi:HSP20 family protein
MSSLLDEDWDLPTVPGLSKVMGQGLNIFETENSLIAEVALPGIPDDKIDISIDQKVVRISASNEQAQEEKDKRKYFMSSMASSYNYSFKLPDGIAADKEPEAILEHGVLKLVFPKAEVIAPKKIKVIAKKSDSKKEISTN